MSAQDSFQQILAEADREGIARMIAFVAEVALVIDPQNRVRAVSLPADADTPLNTASWEGCLFEDVVIPESASAARSLLSSTRSDRRSGAGEIVHPSAVGNVPVRYAAAPAGRDGDIILIGSPVQRRSGAGWSSETLYRSLWDLGADATLLVDGRTGQVRDGNTAAATLLGETSRWLREARLVDVLDPAWRSECSARLRGVLSSGRPDRMTALARRSDGVRLVLALEPSRGGEPGLVVVRLLPADDAETADGVASSLPQLIRESPDPVVLVDRGGTVIWANEAFLTAVGAPAAPLAVGRRVDEFLRSSSETEFSALLETAERQGRLAVEGLWLEGMSSPTVPVDAMLVHVPAGNVPCFGLVLRLRPDSAGAPFDAGTRLDLTGLTDLVGRTPLKDLVQNTTDVIEKMCIEAALRLTSNNRSAAARALGLSRQAFYLKLRRFGLAEHPDD